MDKEYITETEFYKLFMCNKADVTKWCSLGMPRLKEGNERFFNRQDCHDWFSDNRTKRTIKKESNIPDGYKMRKEIAKELGYCEDTILRFVNLGLPFMLIGKSKRYNVEQCKKWIADRKNPTVSADGQCA